MKKTVYIVSDSKSKEVLFVSFNRDKSFQFALEKNATLTAYEVED